MTKFPVLLSIPHGGTLKPPELEGHLSITDRDLFDDSDPFVVELYDLGDKVQRVIKSDIARAFVDLNRSIQDMPPDNPDGLIKSKTCYNKAIYADNYYPDDLLKANLVEKYYQPYHQLIQKNIKQLELQLCLDCHSMASMPPHFSRATSNSKRPLFCISNHNGETSSQEMLELLADSISEAYLINREEITLNDPFQGGYIIKTYGNKPIPWVQIEMNRDLYLSEPWFDADRLYVDSSRLLQLNQQFETLLEVFFKKFNF